MYHEYLGRRLIDPLVLLRRYVAWQLFLGFKRVYHRQSVERNLHFVISF